MCFGGGGGQNTVSTTQVETLPEELVPFYEDLLDRGTYQSLTGYTPYPGRRIAEFDPYESGAQDAYAEMALAGTPESFRESQAVAREAAIGSPYQRAMMADQATREMMRGVGEYRRERPRFTDVESAFGDFTETRELTLPERRERYFSGLDEQQANPYVQQMNAISQQLSDLDPTSTISAADTLANIPIDGDYSQEEANQVAALINSGQMTVQQVADNFGLDVGEVQSVLDQTNAGFLADIPIDGDYSEAEANQVAALINSGQMTVQQVADNFGMDVGEVQSALDQINAGWMTEQRTGLEGQYEGLQTQLDESMVDADLGQAYPVQDEYLLGEGDITGLEGAAIGNLTGFNDATIGNLKSLTGTTVGDIGVEGFRDEGMLAAYMNPYQQQFTDVQKALAREESERAANQIAAQATMAGGLGGYREGVMQSERERNLGTQLSDIQSRGDMENYLQARQAFEGDRAADYEVDVANRQAALQFGESDRQAALRFGESDRQAALQFGEADRQAGFQDLAQARQAFEQDRQANIQRAEYNRAGLGEAAQLGMEGYAQLGGDIDRRLMAGQRMSDLTGTRQAMEVSRLGQLEAAGQRRRGLAQQGLDIGYGDFLRQQTFPIEQLNLYSSMLRGLPVGPGQSQAVYGTQPSAMQQMVGAGISGIGAFNSLTGGGGGWGGTG